MTYRVPVLAPESHVPAHQRGSVAGRFCRVCCGIYPRLAVRHVGKPMYGKDHVSSTCSQEGQSFVDGVDWWEPAVEMRPAAREVEAGSEEGAEAG